MSVAFSNQKPHPEGLKQLRQSALEGDLAAMTLLGRSLLTGDNAPLSPDEGAALIAAASERGSPEAALLTATLEAMGAGRPQSWARAFDCLQFAAERGSQNARAQLVLLSRDPLMAAEASGDGPLPRNFWERLRASLDIAALIPSPPPRVLSEDPRVRVIERFASRAECNWVMRIARRGLTSATVFDRVTGAQQRHAARTNRAVELKLTDMDVVVQLLRARIAAATSLPVPVFEPAQVMHYMVSQEFRPHHDYLDAGEEGYAAHLARFGQRIATFLLYLNDDFEGGATAFPTAKLSYRGGVGDALFFANIDRSGAPDPLTLHAGLPPTRGEKWILSQWIRDRSPGPPLP